MKIYDYTDDGHYAKMTLVFEDNKAVEIAVISKGRKKDEILKDAYILSKGKEKEEFKGDLSKCENFEMPKPKESFLDADFNELKGRVFDQYGDLMDVPINFYIVGTDKAEIKEGKIIEEEVDAETSYFVVAEVGSLKQQEERKIYPVVKSEAPREPNFEDRLKATEQAMADLMMILGGEQ